MMCPVCTIPFTPTGRRRYCSDACKQAAWRRRHPAPPAPAAPPPAPTTTVYQCPECDARYFDERRCPDCNLFCRRLGPGGSCPHCDEPVAAADLIA